MKVAFTLSRGMRAVARTGALARGTVGVSLLAGLTGFVAGCGGGAVAPVQSPTESAIPGRAREHVVGTGDTLYLIAWRHGVDYRTLAGVNSIRDPFTIYPGQRLLVPEPGEVVEPDPPPEAERNSVANEVAASGDLSVRGVGMTQAPVATPLPPLSTPESKPSTRPPREASTQPQQPVPEAVPKPVAVDLPPKPPLEASAPRQRPVTKSAAQPPLAARTVAGLQWTRPTGGNTISTFGRGGNKGIDIEGAFEQPIRAAARGQVVYAGSGLIGYGKLVIVKHSSRLLSAYAHNERLHVGEGDEVKGGQHLADMGRSGKGRVMLHFEVRRDGKPIDPLGYLP